MDLLARREHSRWEIQQKLIKKGAGDLLDSVLDHLEQDGLLSDQRYCEARVRYRINKGFGPLKIRAELLQRGVSSELISACLHNDDDRWLAVISQLIERKYTKKVSVDPRLKAVQQRFLQQRGFTFSQIRRALSECSTCNEG